MTSASACRRATVTRHRRATEDCRGSPSRHGAKNGKRISVPAARPQAGTSPPVPVEKRPIRRKRRKTMIISENIAELYRPGQGPGRDRERHQGQSSTRISRAAYADAGRRSAKPSASRSPRTACPSCRGSAPSTAASRSRRSCFTPAGKASARLPAMPAGRGTPHRHRLGRDICPALWPDGDARPCGRGRRRQRRHGLRQRAEDRPLATGPVTPPRPRDLAGDRRGRRRPAPLPQGLRHQPHRGFAPAASAKPCGCSR